LDFILAGFDKEGNAHIRFTNCLIPPQDYDVTGFWAVGSGAHSAIGSLCHAEEHLGFSRFCSAEVSVYHVLAAKFMAESATDVGKETFVVALKARVTDGKKYLRFLSYWDGLEYVREQWEKHGAPRVPSDITEAISALLIPHDQENTPEVVKRVAKYSEKARKFLSLSESQNVPSDSPFKQLGDQKSKREP